MHNIKMEDIITGVADIDRDHKHLYSLLEKLKKLNIASTKCDEMLQLLNCVIDSAFDHCDREETIMRAIKLPNLSEHVRDHDKLIACLSKIVVDYQLAPAGIPSDTIIVIKYWVTEHIIRYDRPLAEAISNFGKIPIAEQP